MEKNQLGFREMESELESKIDEMKVRLELLRELDSLYLDHRFKARLESLRSKLAMADIEREELENSLASMMDILPYTSNEELMHENR